MTLMRGQDRALFTAAELALIESSAPLRIKAHTPAQLKARMARARRYWDKYRGLARQQNRRSKKSRHPGRPQPLSNLRTERKAEVFAASLDRFTNRLDQLIEADESKRAAGRKPVRKRSRRPGAQRATVRRKQQQSQAASEAALAPRIERQFQKSKMRAIQGHIRAGGTRRQAKRDAR